MVVLAIYNAKAPLTLLGFNVNVLGFYRSIAPELVFFLIGYSAFGTVVTVKGFGSRLMSLKFQVAFLYCSSQLCLFQKYVTPLGFLRFRGNRVDSIDDDFHLFVCRLFKERLTSGIRLYECATMSSRSLSMVVKVMKQLQLRSYQASPTTCDSN